MKPCYSFKSSFFLSPIVFILFAFASLSSSSQVQWCGADAMHNHKLKTDSTYARSIRQQNAAWIDYKTNSQNVQRDLMSFNSNNEVYTIPVVFHIVHTGQPIGSVKNPSNATIQSLITYLNQVYSACCSVNTNWGQYPDTNNGGVNVPIQFVLAKRTPDCQSTNGIVRVNGSSLPGYAEFGVTMDDSPGASDEDVKSLSTWNTEYYLNIWIVTGIQNESMGVAGYAYLPTGYPFEQDGIVLHYDYLQWAIAHEVGHYLGLSHTFQGSTDDQCPANGDCVFDGDMICDTAPHKLTDGCPTGTNPCTGQSWIPVVYNIMNYTNCPNRFTTGQRERMLYSLLNLRPSILHSNGGLALNEEPAEQPLEQPKIACVPTSISTPNNEYNIGPHSIILSSLHYSSTGYTGDSNSFYIDNTQAISNCLYTKLQPVAYLHADTTYTLLVSNGWNPENTKAWIDWNNSGTFTSDELVLNSSGAVGQSFETVTSQISVPTSATTCTPLRMRISSDYYASSAPTPCGNPVYGQVEDFIVWIKEFEGISTYIEEDFCEGDSFEYHGSTYTQSTNFQNTYTNTNGCDSLVAVSLTFHSVLSPAITANDNILSIPPIYSTYQWWFNEAPIPGAVSSQYEVTSSGIYRVEVTNEFGCSSISEDVEFIISNSDNNTISPLKITILLSEGKLWLNSPINTGGDVSIFSSSGALIFKEGVPSLLTVDIDISKYAKGVYVVKITSGNTVHTQKFSME